MMLFSLFKALGAVVSVALAAGLLARDHGLKANRLIAAFLLCNGWWALLEFFLYQTDDPAAALGYYRWMSFGWVPLGTLCAHASLTLSALERHPLSRLLPLCYAGLAVMLPIAIATDWVIRDAVRISLGWRAEFGPGMFAAYGLLAVPLVVVLGAWRSRLHLAESGGHPLLARIVFFGISTALVSATITSILLPLAGIEAAGFTTTLVAFVGLAAAWTLRNYGHSLISAEAFAREILDTLEDGVILVGRDGCVRDVNRAFLRWVGEPESRVVGSPVAQWLPALSVAPETETETRPAPESPSISGDPSESASASASALRGPGSSSCLAHVLTRRGESVPVVLSSPVACNAGGRHFGNAYALRDRREIVSLQRRLVVSARLAAVGDLSAAISTSISQPVSRLQEEFEGLALDWDSAGDLALLSGVEEECGEAISEGRELVEECVEGARRISSIVREVAGFSPEGERAEFAPFSLEAIVRRAVRVAQVQAPEGCRIEARLDSDVLILGHFAEIERVVTNLLANALQALDRSRSPGHVAVAIGVQAGRALLHVEDDGCGIAPEALDRIFDPFFTTKPVGKGTGLGLAISYHIVKAHEGEIRVSSVPGRGTSIVVELPCAPDSATGERASAQPIAAAAESDAVGSVEAARENDPVPSVEAAREGDPV